MAAPEANHKRFLLRVQVNALNPTGTLAPSLPKQGRKSLLNLIQHLNNSDCTPGKHP
jgi:hypothetical protein